ncbi:hypothetical protein [Ancylobacter sp.]|uniref:hypothetical protein n=1 Tax=Ancylobacter sp. TaxID=1872567 RepID=UPI003C7E7D52
MSKITVFKNKEAPAKLKRGRPLKYPWLTLQVDQAFIAPLPYRTFRLHVYRAARIYGLALWCGPCGKGTKVVRTG